MSVDPSAVIVAVATAASALVQGVDIPEHLEEQVTQVIESFQASAESSAAATDQQVTDLVAALPEPMRPAAEQAVADATSAAKDALMPHLPPEAVAVLEGAPEAFLDPMFGVAEAVAGLDVGDAGESERRLRDPEGSVPFLDEETRWLAVYPGMGGGAC